MRVLIGVICLCLATLPALCESSSKYEVGTIMEVKPHHNAQRDASEVTTYDVFVKVGDTIYSVLYTPPPDEISPKYFAGRSLLVLVERGTITYNDILGRSFKVPIESQRPATSPKENR